MSEFIVWSDEWSVGIEEIDEQHKVLVNLINRMHNAIAEKHGSEIVSDILAELADYTKIHFAVEESLMRILGYPGYEEHKDVHDDLLEHVVDLQKKAASSNTSISFELIHFLKSWLSKHIMEEDMQYTGFMLAASAQPKLEKKSWIRRLCGS